MTSPAGWYPAEPQRSGEERYWDGGAWTSAYRPMQRTAPSTPAIRKPPTWGMWLMGAGLLATLLGAGIQYSARHTTGNSSPDTSFLDSADPQATSPDEYSAPEPTATEPGYTAADTNKLKDKGWVVESFDASDDGYGGITGRARIKNANLDTETATFTFTLTKNGAVVGALQGSAQSIAPDQVYTADLYSTDQQVPAHFNYTFQVDTSIGE